MYKDCHVHTILSHDGKSRMDDYIKVARQKFVDEICFTEHFDIYDGLNTTLKTLDVEQYFQYYLRVKNDYDFNFNFGIEIGLQPDIVDTVESLIERYPFDFIIGSSHITCKQDIAMKESTFFEGLSRQDSYMKYFEEVLKNVQLHDNFDVYGHIDYVVRYGGYSSKVIEYKDFSDILDAILSELIQKRKGIEINTSGYRYGLPYPHPNFEIIKRFKELGGDIITIGSDAHSITDLGRDFNLVYDILKSLSISEIAVFRKRIPYFIKI